MISIYLHTTFHILSNGSLAISIKIKALYTAKFASRNFVLHSLQKSFFFADFFLS
jgi:hypothetical protein